jgi:hypothetical protein
MNDKLTTLCIDTQKDQIIARLLLQKSVLYVALTEKWLDGFLSKGEIEHVKNFACDEDKKVFADIYNEILDI